MGGLLAHEGGWLLPVWVRLGCRLEVTVENVFGMIGQGMIVARAAEGAWRCCVICVLHALVGFNQVGF